MAKGLMTSSLRTVILSLGGVWRKIIYIFVGKSRGNCSDFSHRPLLCLINSKVTDYSSKDI